MFAFDQLSQVYIYRHGVTYPPLEIRSVRMSKTIKKIVEVVMLKIMEQKNCRLSAPKNPNNVMKKGCSKPLIHMLQESLSCSRCLQGDFFFTSTAKS